jgi:hypothetical protein
MSDVTMNPAAPHFLPGFIVAPGETDVLLIGVAVFLVVLVLFMGSMYFWLHSIPERISHGSSKTQFTLVAVMSLLALFTHNSAFWVAALLLALVPIPDFWTPLAGMAESLAKMAGRRLHGATADEPAAAHEEGVEVPPSLPHAATDGHDGGTPISGNGGSGLAVKAGGGRWRVLSKKGA